MITRRTLLGAAASAGVLAAVPGAPALAAGNDPRAWRRDVSANGWRIDPSTVATYPIEGAVASVTLRQGHPAAILLHIARRWHYEIAPLDTGEGGGIAGYRPPREIGADFESNYFSGTAIELHPTAYPLAGSEPLWPHHEAIVRDILVDCEGTVVWGGDQSPVKASHFELVAGPGDRALARVGARLDTSHQTEFQTQTPGRVADPASQDRRRQAASLPRPHPTG